MNAGSALPLALLLAASAAHAADPAPIAGKHDSNAPIDFTADRIEVQDRAHRAIWSGDVRAVQAEMVLTAATMTANYLGSISDGGAPGADGKAAGPQIQRIDASGSVVVTKPGEVAHGDYGIYDLDKKLITMIGHVTLDRNGSIVRGGRLVIDQTTNRATVDGSNVGGAGSAGTGGRVSGRFTVASSDKDDKQAAKKP